MVNGFSGNSSKKPQKRPNNAEKSYDVPLEQRLENLSVDIPSTSNAPTSESLVHLLLQVRPSYLKHSTTRELSRALVKMGMMLSFDYKFLE